MTRNANRARVRAQVAVARVGAVEEVAALDAAARRRQAERCHRGAVVRAHAAHAALSVTDRGRAGARGRTDTGVGTTVVDGAATSPAPTAGRATVIGGRDALARGGRADEPCSTLRRVAQTGRGPALTARSDHDEGAEAQELLHGARHMRNGACCAIDGPR